MSEGGGGGETHRAGERTQNSLRNELRSCSQAAVTDCSSSCRAARSGSTSAHLTEPSSSLQCEMVCPSTSGQADSSVFSWEWRIATAGSANPGSSAASAKGEALAWATFSAAHSKLNQRSRSTPAARSAACPAAPWRLHSIGRLAALCLWWTLQGASARRGHARCSREAGAATYAHARDEESAIQSAGARTSSVRVPGAAAGMIGVCSEEGVFCGVDLSFWPSGGCHSATSGHTGAEQNPGHCHDGL